MQREEPLLLSEDFSRMQYFRAGRCYRLTGCIRPRWSQKNGSILIPETSLRMKSTTASTTLGQPAKAILWGGLVAGALDLTFARIAFGKTLPVLLRMIAGGLLGTRAAEGGSLVALLGLACHFAISVGAAAIYYQFSRMMPLLNRHPFVCGPIYGLVVYEVMHLVVLPLSAYHKPVQLPPLFVPDVFSHLFFVGLPIALIVGRFRVKPITA
jgi:hypothetical protein